MENAIYGGEVLERNDVIYWSIKHVAKTFDIHTQTVRRAYRNGELPFIRAGKGLKIWIPASQAMIWGQDFGA